MSAEENDYQLERRLNGALARLNFGGPETRSQARKLAAERDAVLVNCDGLGPTPVPRPLSAAVTAKLEAILKEADCVSARNAPELGMEDSEARQKQLADARAAKLAAEKAAREAALAERAGKSNVKRLMDTYSARRSSSTRTSLATRAPPTSASSASSPPRSFRRQR